MAQEILQTEKNYINALETLNEVKYRKGLLSFYYILGAHEPGASERKNHNTYSYFLFFISGVYRTIKKFLCYS